MPSVLSSVLAGRQLDHYSLEDLVATGTTASIYRGTDLRTGRQVAIKIPHAEVESDPLLSERFRREQTIGRQLNHPCVVKFVSDESRDGGPVPGGAYLVMDWVQGQPLRRILSSPGNVQGKLPPERAIRIALGICDALEYIHGQGVVHRDLKPENIMVDAGDRITLMDFGLASLNGARRVTFGKLSQIVGTVDYISPEQVSGIRGDARSDLYALGVMLYEMLAGATPFPGDNPFVIMNHRLIGDPVPPREMNPEISAELQEILYRALERDPRHRYASAREFAWDLRHPQRVGAADRPELRNRQRPALRTKTPLRYGAFILIPLIAMALLYIARHT